MLDTYDIKIKFDCQSLESTHLSFSPNRDKSVIFFKSSLKSEELKCPLCGGKVYIYDNAQVILKDMPIWAEVMCESSVHIHRYRCTKCNKTFTESIPFKYPGTRITTRAADWIKEFLRGKLSIKTIQEMTGIHWDTIRKIQKEMMDNAIYNREDELKKIGYKPKRLAVDEFAIHKGHSYATCVMDLDTGDVIWAGLGRALKDSQKFFDDVPSDYLSVRMAV